ncbi:acyl-CoA N-acyltransferase [Crucibulum laeve]|uniref:Acyl-CoA N-acyltransferase n=1 Tax=Crucibulum laeve TaxID=68775 RepID=A0A5C3LWS8_9AGAR|nr:acyl-CoA N-acyltransferase [Crucibulum laeve]
MLINTAGYPPDEAASFESFSHRQSQAGDLFLGAYLNASGSRELIGYTCSTLSSAETLTHESMSKHVPNSSSVCIHSVCVALSHRRKGVGLRLLKEYVSRLEAARKNGPESYDRILLITHEELRPFYEKAGFEWLGKSNVVHGSKPWYGMSKNLASKTSGIRAEDVSAFPPAQVESRGQQLPPGLWEALQRPSRNRPTTQLISTFRNGIADIISPDPDRQGVSTNKFDLLCPRPDCGSVILKEGAGKWVERASVQMEPADINNPLLPSLPTPPETTQWWLITPSPMAFENIGFTRPIVAQNPGDPKMKLLTCAECDLGPLGWSEEGGSEFWLACSRVGYKA